MTETSFTLDSLELQEACKQVRTQARVLTLLTGMSADDSDTFVDLAVSFYIKARVRRH